MITIPHDPELAAGTWRRSDVPDNILVKCPRGHIGVLDHDIDDDGTVTPSVQCPSCEWHEMIRLDGWRR